MLSYPCYRIEVLPNSQTYITEEDSELFETHSTSLASLSEEVETEDDASYWPPADSEIDASEVTSEVASDYEQSDAQWDVRTQSHSVDEFGCTWVQRLTHSHDQWSYFTRRAKKLAQMYGVPPEELVFGEHY